MIYFVAAVCVIVVGLYVLAIIDTANQYDPHTEEMEHSHAPLVKDSELK